MSKHILGIDSIESQYDAYIVDLWGVMHDGVNAYPGAVEALKKLRALGKEVVFLSNGPRRVCKAIKSLEQYGISRDLYKDVVTSGELLYQAFKSKAASVASLGETFYYIGPKKDHDLLDGTDCKKVDAIAKSDFIVVTGFRNAPGSLDAIRPDLDAALARKLPLICANPDLIVVSQTGEAMLCAGAIAEEYKKLGGEVIEFGKPYLEGYDACFAKFTCKDKSKILAIGDSYRTDIKGANAAEISSLLIVGGIHKSEIINDNRLLMGNVKKLSEERGARPSYVSEYFSW
jgi:HAD superfamily hydrolase (TIGR01459 family)